LERALDGLTTANLLSVLPRTADFHGLLCWLEAVCRTRRPEDVADLRGEPQRLRA
jgi:hypothetical protein